MPEKCIQTEKAYLIGSVYLWSSPSSILHVVLFHLGTHFWTGSNVACRLVNKREATKNKGKPCQVKMEWKSHKGATGRWSIMHELTHFDSQLWKKLVVLRKLAKRERSSVWSRVTAFLDSTRSNHKSYVFPMFLPSSPHRKPQSAYSDSTSKAFLPVCWNRMTEWQINMDMYFDTNCLACKYLMLGIQRYKSAYPRTL